MFQKIKEASKSKLSQMIGVFEKDMQKEKVEPTPVGIYDGVNLKVLPKFICYKAALLKQKGTLELFVSLLSMALVSYFVITRFEISSLYDKLRSKEYILAPGVIDFTPASSQSVSDEYVSQAVMEFVSQFVNINPANIDERYESLANAMSSDLQIKFRSEASSWREKVKQDNLFEMASVTSKQIESDAKGSYRVVAKVKTSSFVGSEHIGVRDEVIEMGLKLMPPREGKRWFLEMTSLSKGSLDSYNVKKSFGE